jgi:hypothetical protein
MRVRGDDEAVEGDHLLVEMMRVMKVHLDQLLKQSHLTTQGDEGNG